MAAILVADFVGSTPAMEADEEGAVRRIAACMNAVTEAVGRHQGQVFGTAGDAVLAEFPSALAALRAAMGARGGIAAVPNASSDDLRFGLHLADVIVVDRDLRGDGVNIAARVQSAAGPGEIHVTQHFYDHVRRMSPCSFEEVGERRFKGISEPINILRVGQALERHRFQMAPTRTAKSQAVRLNSVAVIPFTIASAADQDQSYLAEGLTDDLTLELGRLKNLFVSSRSASTALATKDPVEIGKALGVRFLVGGTLRRMGSHLRMNVSLVETEHGQLVWSDRIQRPFGEVLDVLDEITARVSATVSGRIEQAELSVVRFKRPEEMSAYEYYLLGLDHHRLGGVADQHYREAIKWFEKAMRTDPSFSRPFAMHVCASSGLPNFDFADAKRNATRALELDPADPEAHRIMGALKLHERDFAASRFHHERAIDLAPNDAYMIGRCAAFYLFAGEPQRALALLDRAESLDPFLPVYITEERVATLYVLERYAELIGTSNSLPTHTRRTLLYSAAALTACAQPLSARQVVLKALALDPALSAVYLRTQELYDDERITETLIERACAAGLPGENPVLSAA